MEWSKVSGGVEQDFAALAALLKSEGVLHRGERERMRHQDVERRPDSANPVEHRLGIPVVVPVPAAEDRLAGADDRGHVDGACPTHEGDATEHAGQRLRIRCALCCVARLDSRVCTVSPGQLTDCRAELGALGIEHLLRAQLPREVRSIGMNLEGDYARAARACVDDRPEADCAAPRDENRLVALDLHARRCGEGRAQRADCRRRVLQRTHADHFCGDVPCTDRIAEQDVAQGYEEATGHAIVAAFADREPSDIPGVLVTGHGPFACGRDASEAASNAAALELVAELAYHCLALAPDLSALDDALREKHFRRKHGPDAYYGQRTA